MVKTIKNQQKRISNSLISEIIKIQKQMQIKYNVKYGKKSPRISFVMASNELAKRFKQ